MTKILVVDVYRLELSFAKILVIDVYRLELSFAKNLVIDVTKILVIDVTKILVIDLYRLELSFAMVKRKKRKKKAGEEWKKLRKAHLKGPKRVKLPVERRRKGVDPLLSAEHSRRIQIEFETRHSDKFVSVIVLRSVFEQMGLKVGDVKTMKEDQLHQSARSLRKTFDVLVHNDRVLNRSKLVKFNTFVRRAWVFGNAFSECDAHLRITHSDKSLATLAATKKHIDDLFKSHGAFRNTDVEYM